jgi:ribosomal protein S18 acetylase RimI-like enzyme
MEIRRATAADVPAVLDLWARARSSHATTPDTPEALNRLLADAPRALIVAGDGDEIVGAVIAGWDGRRGNLYRLAVDPRHRRQGVARALVAAAEAELRVRGAHRITVLVAHDDEVAAAIWTAAGYAFDDEVGRFVRNV